MTLFQLIFGLVVGSLIGVCFSYLLVKLRSAANMRVKMLGGLALRMFLPGLTVGMVIAMNAFPPAPPAIGKLSAQVLETARGATVDLIAEDVRYSTDRLMLEGFPDGHLDVGFYVDRDGSGTVTTENLFLGLAHREAGNRWIATVNRQALPAGTCTILARATAQGRQSNVASVTLTTPD